MECSATFAVFCSLAILPLSAQTPLACAAKLIPLKPVGLYCQNAVPVCVTDSNGINGQWVWGCPTSSSNVQLPPTINVPPQPQLQYPHIDTPMDAYRKAVEIRQMQQQTELMRQQTEELRQQNESRNQGNLTSSLPMVPPTPEFPLASAYASMPSPTGKKKQDQRNWNLWLRQNPTVAAQMPPWSAEAYEQVRRMAAAQVTGAR